MGVHTGDSWTVAPQQTLDDPTYQRLRDAAFATARAVGVATGGANVQFAVHPETLEVRVIEMNPRVSRSSALASKATGVPIAKLAALLAVGYTLDELPNDITGTATAAFEPALDYVAVKAPRFEFEKFPWAERRLGAEMRAIGEALGLGRTFAEAFRQGVRGPRGAAGPVRRVDSSASPCPERWDLLLEAARRGLDLPGIHPYFADRLRELAAAPPASGRPRRLAVDSCAGEFDARTPYYYVTHEGEDEGPPPSGRAVIVLGGGPNRIGQAIEFDYCCVHAARALRTLGYEAVLVNSNPETVSTDYDSCDRLYLEPLTAERVLEICELEQPVGVAVSFGGPDAARARAGAGGGRRAAARLAARRDRRGGGSRRLRRARRRARAAVGERRGRRRRRARSRSGSATRCSSGRTTSSAGAASTSRAAPTSWTSRARASSTASSRARSSSTSTRSATARTRGSRRSSSTSSRSARTRATRRASSRRRRSRPTLEDEIRAIAATVARGLGARGLLNLQLAVHERRLFVLEANPRASRTVPFVAKATEVPLVEHAVRLLLGARLGELGLPERAEPTRAWAKEAVFPVERFPGADVRGPEMRSTGEVMAGGRTPREAYARALRAAGRSRRGGTVLAPLQQARQSQP